MYWFVKMIILSFKYKPSYIRSRKNNNVTFLIMCENRFFFYSPKKL